MAESFERWEPTPSTKQPARRAESGRPPAPDRRAALAGTAMAAAGRLGIAAAFLLPRLLSLPSVATLTLSLMVLGAHFAVVYLAWRDGLQEWSVVWLVDLLTLGLVAPAAVVNGFVAAGDGPLLPAARGAYHETWLVTALTLLGLTWVALRLDRRLPGSGGVLITPAALLAPTLLAVLRDYRDVQALTALALAYAVAAGATLGALVLPAQSRQWLAPVTWLAVTLVLLAVAPGLPALGARTGLVRAGQVGLLLLAGGCVLAASLRAPTLPARRPRPRARRPR